MGWLTWSYQLVCLQLVVLHLVSCANLCSRDQSSALLNFKQLFLLNNYYSPYECKSSYPKMKHWKEDNDCCSWDGVTCDMVTGHVIGLDLSCSWLVGTIPSNSSLFLLSHLQKLNLAFNFFSFSKIPSDFGRLKSLTHLNLSYSYFSSPVPLEISHLSKLVSLDLSVITEASLLSDPFASLKGLREPLYFGFLTLETSVMKGLVQNMTDLEELVLSGVTMSTIDPASLSNLSSSLTLLNLQDCSLQGMFPENIFHLPKLQEVNLHQNNALTGYLDKVNWSSTLRYLDVSYTSSSGKLPYSIGDLKFMWHLDINNCNFMGSVPASIGNLSQLLYLDLSYNKFSGHIPSSLSNLEHLSILDLSDNRLSGQIPTSFGTRFQNLAYVNLHNNFLDGTIPSRLFTLPFLVYMDLSSNQLTGCIAEFQKTALATINLSNNRLHGPIPCSIVEPVNLTRVYLFSNNLSGTVELSMFAKLKKLEELHLSDNSLSLLTTTNKVNFSFPQLTDLALSSCNINEFPSILSTAKSLQSLDLSDNKIHGQIPIWLYKIRNLSHLNLSLNYLTAIERFPWMDLRILDLHSNLLKGQLPTPPPDLEFFSISHNNMIGAIPSSFCNLTSIQYLDLSTNSLHGNVPQCLGNFGFISVLDLRMNNFHGSIPHTFANNSWLRTLNLNGNKLEGPLPPLVNCVYLEVLDVGNNMINDTFPHWLATLPELQVLILRSNRFHGSLGNPKTRPFPKLRILDLSHNSFTGHLQSRFFKNFQAMMNWKKNGVKLRYMGYYYNEDSIIVTMKGVDTTLERILTIFTTMDLSSNKFRGQIPKVVEKLNSLKVLNFSHNNLRGHIPISLKNLTELESLDLSSNRLEGEIPKQLTSLTSLSVLNLSYNRLEGPIPQGNQFNTFENNTYIGNLGLCGLPLSKKCNNNEAPKIEPTKFLEEPDTASSWFDWKMILMGYGSGLVIGLSMGYIAFSTGKPWWFVSMVERKVLKLAGRNRRRKRIN